MCPAKAGVAGYRKSRVISIPGNLPGIFFVVYGVPGTLGENMMDRIIDIIFLLLTHKVPGTFEKRCKKSKKICEKFGVLCYNKVNVHRLQMKQQRMWYCA